MSDPLIDALLNKQSGQQGQQAQVDPIHDPINALLSKQSNSNNTPPGPIQGAPNGLPGDNPPKLSNKDVYLLSQKQSSDIPVSGGSTGNMFLDALGGAQGPGPGTWTNQYNTPEAAELTGTAITAPVQKVGQIYSHVAPSWLGSDQVGNVVNNIQNNKEKLLKEDSSGAASALYNTTDAATQIGLAEALGLPTAIGKITPMTTGLGALGRIYNGVRAGGIGGLAFGALHSLTTPNGVDNTTTLSDYLSNEAKNVLNEGTGGMLGGMALGGSLSSLGEVSPAVKAVRRAFTPGAILPPEALTNESVNDVLAASGDEELGNTPQDIQKAASQGNTEAKDMYNRLTTASARDNNVTLSAGDATNNPEIRAQEIKSESRAGSSAIPFRQKQNEQLNTAINNLKNEAHEQTTWENNDQQQAVRPFDNEDLIDEAAANGDTHAQELQQDIRDSNRSQTPEKTIQTSLKARYWSNINQDRVNYTNLANDITTASQTTGIPDKVDISPSSDVQTTLNNLITENNNSVARSPELDNILQKYKTQFNNPSADNSIMGIKAAVSKMESEIEAFKRGATPNRSNAFELGKLKASLDTAADNQASNILGDTKEVDTVSNFHKNNVVPFRDTDTGLPQIIAGQDADRSVKPFFAEASPEQFQRLHSLLDTRGQAAIQEGIINNALDAATTNGKTNPQIFSKYVTNRSEGLANVLNPNLDPPKELLDLFNKTQGLAHLIQNTPRAGAPLLTTQSGSNPLVRRAVGGVIGSTVGGIFGGGIPGALVGGAAGTGAEMLVDPAINKVESNILFGSKIGEDGKVDLSNLNKWARPEVGGANSLPSPKIPPSAPPPETGSLTQPPGGPRPAGGSGIPFTPVSDNLAAQKQAILDYQAKRLQNYQDTVGVAETALNKQNAQNFQSATTPANFKQLELGYNAKDASGHEFTNREPTLAELTQLGDRIEGKIQHQQALKYLPTNQRPGSVSDDFIDSESKADKIALAKLDAHIENVKNGTVPTVESRYQDMQNAENAESDLELAKANFNKQDTASIQELNRNLQNSRTTRQALNKTQNSQSQPSTTNLAISLQPNTASGSPAYGTPQTGITNLGRMGGPDEFPEGPGSWKQQQDKLQQLLSSGKTATNKPGMPGTPAPNLSEQTLANQAISEYLAANPKANPTAAPKTPTPAEVPPVAWTPEKEAPQTLDEADKQLSGLQNNLQDRIQQAMDDFKGGDKNAALELVHLRSIQQNIDRIKALGGNPLLGASNELDAAQQQYSQLRNTPKTTKPLSTADAQVQAEKWAAEQSIKNSLAQKPSSIVSDHQNYMTHRGGLYTTPNGETGIVPADEVEAIWSSPYLSEKEKISGTSRPSGMSLSQWISELISRGKIGKGK